MLIMHHHTTLDIPIIESEKNIAHENLLENQPWSITQEGVIRTILILCLSINVFM